MADNYAGMSGGGGVNKSENTPDCTKKYWPSLGGTEGSTIEAGGEQGAKDVGEIGGEVSAPSEEGQYNTVVNSYPPGIPHGPADPAIEGPPLASTPENDPTRSMY
jgi:hypothetical protein